MERFKEFLDELLGYYSYNTLAGQILMFLLIVLLVIGFIGLILFTTFGIMYVIKWLFISIFI